MNNMNLHSESMNVGNVDSPSSRGPIRITSRDPFGNPVAKFENIHPLSRYAGLHETEGVYRNGMAPSTHVR